MVNRRESLIIILKVCASKSAGSGFKNKCAGLYRNAQDKFNFRR